MNEAKKDIWEDYGGGVYILWTPTISARIECKDNRYLLSLVTVTRVPSCYDLFDTLEEAKMQAIMEMRRLIYKSLQIIEPPPQGML